MSLTKLCAFGLLCAGFAQICLRASGQTAQPQLTRAQAVQRVCGSSELRSGPEFDEMQRIKGKLAPVVDRDKSHAMYAALIGSNIVNAWTKPLDMRTSVICIPTIMVHFMGDAEGGLAFVLSHEIGHALDDQCKTASGRAQIAQSAAPLRSRLGALLGGPNGAAAVTRMAAQQSCEARADEIGFYVFVAAGYNPFDAAGAFGRLEMYFGDMSTGVLARLAAMGKNHPMTPDRIKHMRSLLIEYENRNSGGR